MSGTSHSLKIAIITLIREGEGEPFSLYFKSLAPQLDQNRRLFVLANGSAPPDLERQISSSSFVQIDQAPTNLGVAGGRNRLIQKAIEWSPDVIVSLDNDILIPSDYLQTIETIFQQPDSEKIGIIAPVLFNYFEDKRFLKSAISSFLKNNLVGTDRQTLKQAIKDLPLDLRNTFFFHGGIRRFRLHYLFSIGSLLYQFDRRVLFTGRFKRLRYFLHKNFWPQLSRSYFWQNRILNEDRLIEVDCLPGGVQIFRPALYKKIGPVDESFNPFGYEDAEFSIRALKFGFKNYVASSLYVIHDVQCRNSSRPLDVKFYYVGRARSLMLKKTTASVVIRLLSTLDSWVIMPYFVNRAAKGAKVSASECISSYLRGLRLIPYKKELT